jgi:uncharacterized membrane protein YuzA (DUF378 family)
LTFKTANTYMTTSTSNITLRKAALIAGIGYLLMIGSPIAESMFYHGLVDSSNATKTVKNIAANAELVRYGILLYLINFMGDILAAWGLYILFKPVNESLSLLSAWLRIIYSVMGLVAVMNLLTVLQLTSHYNYLQAFTNEQLQAQVMIALRSFRDDWSFSFTFFGIYLILLGYLAFISKYVSKIVGICLMIAGAGWLTDSLQPLLFPSVNISIGMIAGFGELVFMFWLFIKGVRLKEQN